MALIIEGMKKPESCWVCRIESLVENCPCRLGISNASEYKTQRHPNCPIVGEIPDKHGALKDANTLKELTKNTEIRNSRGEIYPIGKAIAKMIDEAPTVVESEE